MEITTRIVEKDAFPVIGMMGRGPAGTSAAWIGPLWQSSTQRFDEIAPLVLMENGSLPCLWGAMSDVSGGFSPWGEEGLYLAGVEAKPGTAAAPEGWTLWTVPAYQYLVADTTSDNYGEVFATVRGQLLAEKGFTLAGAVHERYPQPGNPNVIELYFPIKKL